jgi:hypothetical protein
MQRLATFLYATLAAILVDALPARACSTPPPPSVKQAFAQSSAVYLAQVISVTQDKTVADAITEKVVFRVLVALKGAKRRGDTLLLENTGLATTCGRSVLNNPTWLVSDDPTSHDRTPIKLSDTWVLYLSGREPYEGAMSMNSNPINLVDPAELRFLFAHSKSN